MNRRELLRTLGAGALAAGMEGMPFARLTQAAAQPKKILMFTKSSGFEHDMIKRKDGKLGPAEQILTDLGTRHSFEVAPQKTAASSPAPSFRNMTPSSFTPPATSPRKATTRTRP